MNERINLAGVNSRICVRGEPQIQLQPGWYLLPCPVIADVWIEGKHVQKVIPAGWYECISVTSDNAQLSSEGRAFSGQTSRFVVNRSELEHRKYYKYRHGIRRGL